MRSFSVIVAAAAANSAIGRGGQLPWRLPGDMAFFKRTTSDARPGTQQETSHLPGAQNAMRTHHAQSFLYVSSLLAGARNAVLMGRKTWDSIPAKFRPLPGRLNIIVSHQRAELVLGDASSAAADDVRVVSSLAAGLELLAQPAFQASVDRVFVIGGSQVYQEALRMPECEQILLTRVLRPAFDDADAFLPAIDAAAFEEQSGDAAVHTENEIDYQFVTLKRRSPASNSLAAAAVAVAAVAAVTASVDSAAASSASASEQQVQNEEEMQYLRLIADIIDGGVVKGDRTGTGTISKFGLSMRFSLRDGRFPLLTTKQVFWRGVAEELLWFISGKTDARILQDKGIKIWDGNASREYLDSIGLKERETGDLGPVYGFQWRHFGAAYKDMHTDYTGQGVDQLANVIHTIKTNPNDRRIIMSAWNPADLKQMALPPCHMFCQFYVANGELSCCMYQRSCDMGLGVPFNIASYALLTCMIAQVCDLRPGEFVHMMGDAHVYANHVEPLREQLQRAPFAFPTLRINPAVKDIDQFTFADFEVVGYQCHKKIAMKMAV